MPFPSLVPPAGPDGNGLEGLSRPGNRPNPVDPDPVCRENRGDTRCIRKRGKVRPPLLRDPGGGVDPGEGNSPEDLHLVLRIPGRESGDSRERVPRITSYNVCYTKLLR